jgi:hypothetical protein
MYSSFVSMPTHATFQTLRSRLSGIEAEIDRLNAERVSVLGEMLDLCEQRGGRVAMWRPPSRALVRKGNNHHGITQAIRDVVAAAPGQLTSPEVADRLDGRILTSRRDPRRAVVARIHELISQRELRRDAAGRLVLPHR